MERRQILLLGLVGLLVVLVFAAGVVGSNDSERGSDVDDEPDAWVTFLDRAVGRLPGVGRTLGIDDVPSTLDCVTGERLVVAGSTAPACSFVVDAEIDRIVFEYVSGACELRLSGQRGVDDQRVDRSDRRDGRLRLALSGDGPDAGGVIRLSVSSQSSSTCVLAFT